MVLAKIYKTSKMVMKTCFWNAQNRKIGKPNN